MKRDYNIEILRILAMLGVRLCHTLFAGVGHRMFGVSEWLGGLAGASVDVFVFISGWYGIRFKVGKLVALYATAVFCVIESRLAMKAFGYAPAAGSIIGDISFNYWFLHAYAALMCIAPIIESAFENGKSVLKMAIPFLVFVFGWGWMWTRFVIWKLPFPSVHGMESHSWVTLVGVYVAARLCRIYEVDRFLSRITCIVGVVVCAAVAGFHYGILNGYNCVAVLAMTIFMFSFFRKLRIEGAFVAKFCTFVVPSLFAVYLLHQSPFGRMVVAQVGGLRGNVPIPNALCGLMFAILVFVCSFIADMPRRLLVVLWHRTKMKFRV